MSEISWTNIRVKLGDLKPWALNPRQSTKKQAKALLKSWDKFGQVQTIAIGPDGEVLDGHQRLSALLTVHGPGFEIDARQADRPLSDQERRELVVTLHAGAVGSWDWDTLSGWTGSDLIGWGFDADTLKDWKRDAGALQNLIESEKPEALDAEPQTDRAEELREKWQTEHGQLWRIGEHRLLCGDSTVREDVERVMDIPLNLMVTDPPYGVEYDANWRNEAAEKGLIGHADRRVTPVENDGRVDWSGAFDLFPGDIFYCWHADRHASEVQRSMEASGFEIRCQIIWAKPTFAISRGHYNWQHEPLWYAIRKGKTASWIGDHSEATLWEINLDTNVEGGHSTQKPLECMAHPIRNHEGDIYDPFLGSGTTMVACQNLGRRCRGIEISPAYCAVILERMATAFPELEIARIDD